MAAPHVGVHHSDTTQEIHVRTIGAQDIFDAIKLGIADFNAKPSHLFLLGLIYPIASFLGAAWAFERDLIPLIFPIISGYALMGPFAAVILYEVSRRREQGRDFAWSEAFTVFTGPRSRTIGILGLALFVIFITWLLIAQAIYDATIGGVGFDTPVEFLRLVFLTPQGWILIVIGNGAGFLLAVAVLAAYVVSFPMALDRDISPLVAIRTSLRASFASPGAMALWGVIIVGSMIIGALTLLVGLAVVLPVLGHTSWHVYRKVVTR